MEFTPPAVKVRQTPTKGRALVSAAALTPGATILTTTPLLLLPSLPHLASFCTNCLKPGSPRACTRCRSAYYCGAACQRAHWRSVHAAECKPLALVRDAGRGDVPTPVRLLMQALLKGEIGSALEPLEGNVQALRGQEGGKRWRDIEVMALGACGCSGVGTTEEQVRRACELMCKIQTNAFNWSDNDGEETGVFLEPTLAMINHSCVPNAEVQVFGRNIVLRASTSIKAGDEIEISYTDYTLPKSKRSQALAPYQFECHCPRCRDDLNVYQACTMYPSLNLNRLSLAPEVSEVRQHPTVTERQKSAAANAHSEKALADMESSTVPWDERSRRLALSNGYRCCKVLVENELWAMAPLPRVVADISSYYAQEQNWTLALTTACLTATACDPYRYPPPFHSARVQGLFRIAKLLSNTAADTNSLSESAGNRVSKTSLHARVQETLRDIDQVSLCQMLIMVVLRLIPKGFAREWGLSVDAQDMLSDIGQLPGREKELSLINAWAANPETDQSQAFFKYAVVDPVHTLAGLGKAVLDNDFKESTG